MNIWEIVILMIVGSICVCGGIGLVYASIVNTVERYQVRKAKRDWMMLSKIFEEIPKCMLMTFELIKKSEEESNEKFRKELEKEIEKFDPDDVWSPEKK